MAKNLDFSYSYQVYPDLLCMHGIVVGLYTVVLFKYAKSHWHNSQSRVWLNVSVIHILKLSKHDLTWQSIMPLSFNFLLCLWLIFHKLQYGTVLWNSISDPYFRLHYLFIYLHVSRYIYMSIASRYPPRQGGNSEMISTL